MTDAGRLWLKIVTMAVIAISASLLIVSFALATRDRDFYPSNIWLGGVSLANMDKQEAYSLLQAELPARWGDKLTLLIGEQEALLPIKEIGISYDFAASLDKIEEEVFAGSGVALLQHSAARGQKQMITPVLSWDKGALAEKVLQIKKEYDQPAIDARIVYNQDYLEYRAHKNGFIINADASMKHIAEALDKGILGPVNISATEVHPRVKIEDIQTVKDIIGVSAKKIDNPGQETLDMVEKLNGIIIMHGEKLDIQKILEADKKESKAPANEGKEQVKGAIMQACLQAGMQETNNGTAVESQLQHPLLLTAGLDGHTLLVKVYGCQTEPGKVIKLLSEREEIHPEVQIKLNRRFSPQQRIVQQEGKKGFILRNYRVVNSGGKLIEKSLLSEEITPATDTIIVVGPGGSRK